MLVPGFVAVPATPACSAGAPTGGNGVAAPASTVTVVASAAPATSSITVPTTVRATTTVTSRTTVAVPTSVTVPTTATLTETATQTSTVIETVTVTQTREAAALAAQAPDTEAAESVPQGLVQPPAAQAQGPFANCTQARAAGAAPVYRGDPGYADKLDRDGDGVGCES
jgi:hypothetical protein